MGDEAPPAVQGGLVVRNDGDMSLYHQAQANVLANQSEKVFDELSKSADYLCRLQLCGSNSTLCKTDAIVKGNYAYIVSKDKFIDLGPSVDIYPIVWRPKALDMSDDSPQAFYDPTSAEFKEVSARSNTKDSGCTYGPEYLVWIPSIKKFASLHFGSKTSRQDAPDLMKIVKERKAATLTWRKVGPNAKGQIWETITVGACSTPFDMPPIEDYNQAIQKFQDEQNKKGPEKASTDAGRAR